MKRTSVAIFMAAALATGVAGQTADKVWDAQLTSLEHEFVPLVEAMPPEKFTFAPSTGEFRNVRTFAQQATHVATVMYEVCAAVLQETVPVTPGPVENGPALTDKAAVVKYVQDAFAYAHRAMKSLTNENQMGMVKSAFGNNQTPRLNMASVAIWHSYDHYGQMALYLRMNKIVPPASR